MRASRAVMTAAACVFPFSVLIALLHSVPIMLGLAAVLAFAHMAWLICLTATALDLFRQQELGTAFGFISAGSGRRSYLNRIDQPCHRHTRLCAHICRDGRPASARSAAYLAFKAGQHRCTSNLKENSLRPTLALLLLMMSAPLYGETYILRADDLTMTIDGAGARYGFKQNGRPVVEPSSSAGMVIGGEPVTHASKISCSTDKCSLHLATATGDRGTLTVELTAHAAQLRFVPLSPGMEARFVTAGAQPAYGLADDAVLNKNYSTDVTGFSNDHFFPEKGWSG